MIYIDLPADLNLEDDEGRNAARLADAVTPDAVTPGAVLVAGAPRAWSWAVVESVDSGFVYFRQVTAGALPGALNCLLPAGMLPGCGFCSLLPLLGQPLIDSEAIGLGSAGLSCVNMDADSRHASYSALALQDSHSVPGRL